MALMKRTNAGTILASTWDDRESNEGAATEAGISVGVYNAVPIVSIECVGNELRLLINDDAVARSGFRIIHTNLAWQVKED